MRTAVDVGAATGDLVKGFLDCGLEAYGIEGDPSCLLYVVCPAKRMIIHDLREPLDILQKGWNRFDICTCWEVAEHIEAEYADVFIDNLCALSDRIFMSACPPNPTGVPGKGSVGHWNEQPYQYWIEKFLKRGYVYNAKNVRRFRACTEPWRGAYGIKAFYDNCMAFDRKKV